MKLTVVIQQLVSEGSRDRAVRYYPDSVQEGVAQHVHSLSRSLDFVIFGDTDDVHEPLEALFIDQPQVVLLENDLMDRHIET